LTFGERLAEAVARAGTPACVGIDPFTDRIPGIRAGMDRAEVADRVRAFGLAGVEAGAGKPEGASGVSGVVIGVSL